MKISIIGMGYVGLPLAVEFAKKYSVVGFDIHPQRVDELQKLYDRTREIDFSEHGVLDIKYTSDPTELKNCEFHIITVPTPVDESKKPDLRLLQLASKTVGQHMKKGDVVVYESTVYPGCTEEVCVPILEKESGLKFNIDFYCGYSPERINPGDKDRTVTKIKKVTAGSTPEASKKIQDLYASIITAGTFSVSSIKVAEAAKVIENTQRDINIAFVNELSLIFSKMNLDTQEVLEAAGTKWNFLKFYPGLVGGHCIGVDPYYLTYKAEALGYHPEVILAGRRINDAMGSHVAGQTVKLMIKKDIPVNGGKVLVLGLTFKENCPDIRNSKVVDVIHELKEFGCLVDVYDPLALPADVEHEYGFSLASEDVLKNLNRYQALVLAVAHKEFKDISLDKLDRKKTVVFDVKSFLPFDQVDGRL